MQRRSFLKLASLAIGALGTPLSFPWTAAAAAAGTVSFAGNLYRAGGRGTVLVSGDDGTTWRLHSDLGDVHTVSKLAVDRSNRLRARISFAGRTFDLVLGPDLEKWLTI